MSRSQSLVLGPAVLGKEAFEQQQATNSLNTGAVGLGLALQKPFKPNATLERAAPMTPARERALAEQDAHRKRIAETAGAAARQREEENRDRIARRAKSATKIAKKGSGKSAKAGNASVPETDDTEPVVVDEPTVISYTEEEVVALLAKDPLQWDVVLDAEGSRPDGPRPAVARAVIAIADKVWDDKPIPAEVLGVLQGITDPAAE